MAEPPAYLDPSEEAVHMDQTTRQYIWEHGESVWEWHGAPPHGEERRVTQGRWIKAIGEDELHKQQEVYSVAGVDESVPAAPVLKRHEGKKRKGEGDRPAAKKARTNTAVFVTNLPLDAAADEIAEVFSRYGVLQEDAQGAPRIKLYHDEETHAFKGEALVVYFKPESVDLAVQLLDETYLRESKGIRTGTPMHVEKAEFRTEEPVKAPEGEKKRGLSDIERRQLQKRLNRMNNKINDWDSSGDESAPRTLSTARTLILKKMFTLAELEQDATLLLDLKQDVRDECASLGEVTNVVLWDLEPEGVITVRFRDPAAARACLAKMDGRYFAGRQIAAMLADGRPKFRRTKTSAESENEGEDAQRADAFGDWLERGGDQPSR